MRLYTIIDPFMRDRIPEAHEGQNQKKKDFHGTAVIQQFNLLNGEVLGREQPLQQPPAARGVGLGWVGLGLGLHQRQYPTACVTLPHRRNWVPTSGCLVPTSLYGTPPPPPQQHCTPGLLHCTPPAFMEHHPPAFCLSGGGGGSGGSRNGFNTQYTEKLFENDLFSTWKCHAVEKNRANIDDLRNTKFSIGCFDLHSRGEKIVCAIFFCSIQFCGAGFD